MITLSSHLPSMALAHKKVFLRADLNIPISNTTIIFDHRLKAILPTIDYLLAHHATIILGTHIGRPTGYDEQLSTKHLIPWFKKQGYAIIHAPDITQIPAYVKDHPQHIILLENLRFYPGEKKHDVSFAQQLAYGMDYYVNDAFALLHRTDTSITLLPDLFSSQDRTIGFLIEKELKELNTLIDNPQKPYTAILGGGKVSTKISLIEALLPHIDNLLLCPALVFSFLYALHKKTGKSLIEADQKELCLEILDKAQHYNVNIMFPTDYYSAHNSFNGKISLVDAVDFPKDGVGIGIGPKTATTFDPIIEQSRTIFYNGLMGSIHNPDTLTGFSYICNAIKKSSGFSVIGGGDSVAAVEYLGYTDAISYASTGGGATLAYIAQEPLPGLQAFIQ